MGTNMQVRCTEAKPVVHRASHGVAGWMCRIEIHLPGATGFDFIQVPALKPWRPIEDWTPDQVLQLLERVLRPPADPSGPIPPYLNKFRELVGIVQFRQDFSIDEPISLLTGKGAVHELTSR